MLAFSLLAFSLRTADAADPNDFTDVTGGRYQVLAQSGAAVGGEVNRFMNLMLQEYGKFFANWSHKRTAQVLVFGNDADFRAYLGEAHGFRHPWLAAVCIPKVDAQGERYFQLVVCENDRLYRDLAHEGFHQFIWYAVGDRAPTWFNEGMAQYFETSYMLRGQLRTGGIDPKKLQSAQTIVRRALGPPVRDLLRMDRAAFYEKPEIHYPLAWAWAYYLMQRENRSYRATNVRDYVRDLQYGRDPVEQFWLRFGRDERQLERDFAWYLLNLRARTE